VKTNEKTARDALREIMSATYGLPCDGAPDMILSRIRDVAQAALDTTATSEVDRLYQRIIGAVFEVEGEHEEKWYSIPADTLTDIFAEFGCGEETTDEQ